KGSAGWDESLISVFVKPQIRTALSTAPAPSLELRTPVAVTRALCQAGPKARAFPSRGREAYPVPGFDRPFKEGVPDADREGQGGGAGRLGAVAPATDAGRRGLHEPGDLGAGARADLVRRLGLHRAERGGGRPRRLLRAGSGRGVDLRGPQRRRR